MILRYSNFSSATHQSFRLLHNSSRIVTATSYRTQSSTSGQQESNKTRTGILKSIAYALGLTTIGFGGFMFIYSKPELRQKLELYAPITKKAFDSIEEDMQSMSQRLDKLMKGRAQIQDEKLKTKSAVELRKESKERPAQSKEAAPVIMPAEGVLKLTTISDLAPQPTALPTTKKEAKSLDISPVDVHQGVKRKDKEVEKMSTALEEQQKIDEKLAKLHMEIEARRMRDKKDLEFDAKIREERELWEAEVEVQLKQAALAHAEHLEKVIKTQKQLHDIENEQLVEEAVNIERNKYVKQIQSAVDKLNGVEQALNSRAAQDLENRRAKIFWTEGQQLMDSLINDTEVAKLKEVQHIKKLTENDDFVQSICNCFSPEAMENGVATEAQLLERFSKVDKRARRYAQIGENGGTPLQYFFSWLQSLLQFRTTTFSSNDQIDMNTYEPYDLLNRINAFVEEGDLLNAVRVANLLRGESAQIFHDWIMDATRHMEARFLAELLLSHAQISSVRTTY